MTSRRPYTDRAEAGDALAGLLREFEGRPDVVVLGLPRGGVPVAARVAAALDARLDVLLVRKLGLPGQQELAMGAIAAVGDALEVVRNDDVVRGASPSDAAFDEVCRREADELRRRESAYRGDRAPVTLRDRVVIVVDDGLATGSTMRAAVAALRRQGPARIVVAVPIGARHTCADLADEVDDVVCPWAPEQFWAVGQGYLDFRPTDDVEVRRILGR